MPTGPIIAGAGAAAAILLIKRQSRLAALESPRPWTTKTGGSMIPVASSGSAAYLVAEGNFVRGLDMNRRTSTGEIVPHWGVDISAPIGTPVYAVKPGRVLHAGAQNGYGNSIWISHTGENQSSVYGHLHEMHVREGDLVVPGQQVGTVGRTCTGPSGTPPAWCAAMGAHLHWEIHPTPQPGFGRMTRRLDPVNWLRTQGTELSGRRI